MIDHDVLKPTSRREFLDRNWQMVSSGVSGSLPEGIDSWACHFDSESLAVDTFRHTALAPEDTATALSTFTLWSTPNH